MSEETVVKHPEPCYCGDPNCDVELPKSFEDTVMRRLEQIQKSQEALHAKVDAIVEVVEGTVKNLGENPMMKMLGKLAGKV